MTDKLVRALAYDGQVRVSAVVDTALVEEARKRHETSPVATAALGRTLTGALLLSWGLKGEGLMTLRVIGDGPIGGIIVTANAFGEARGYVQEPWVELPLNDQQKLDVGGAIGQGHLYVTKDIGLREAYTGSVPLVTGEIGDDIASYLMSSEQTPSLVSVGVLVNPDLSVAASGGIIIQAMPDAPESILADIEKILATVQPVSTLIQGGADAEALIAHYLPDVAVQYLEETPVNFRCHCDRARIGGLLKSMGQAEIADIIANEGESEVVCHFCNTRYHFAKQELQVILAEILADEEA